MSLYVGDILIKSIYIGTTRGFFEVDGQTTTPEEPVETTENSSN